MRITAQISNQHNNIFVYYTTSFAAFIIDKLSKVISGMFIHFRVHIPVAKHKMQFLSHILIEIHPIKGIETTKCNRCHTGNCHISRTRKTDILVKKKDDTATDHYACNGKYKLPCSKSHRNRFLIA